MRPDRLQDVAGQRHLLGEDRILSRLLTSGHLPSLLLWGPPGTGKTTLARIIATDSGADFIFFSAVLSGVKEIRQIVQQATERLDSAGIRTVLFIDEIHRFNKSQQDALLPHVESGLLTLIGATTENPSFEVIAPLLSRSEVLVLEPLNESALAAILRRALADRAKGLGEKNISIDEDALLYLAAAADGDARRALNSLEVAAAMAIERKNDETLATNRVIDLALAKETVQRKHLRYDKDGEEHYNLISALHKSLRDSDPDGALYWLCRMLAAGEDPLYIARRLIRFASEDIGNADPQALAVTINARDSYHTLGSPEGELALAQATLYLATAPKSNATYLAYKKVMEDIRKTGSLPVPMAIRNAPTRLMRELGYGKSYQYAHDDPDAVVLQQHLPDKLAGRTYYRPTNRGHEAVILDRLSKWRTILAQRSHKQPNK